METDDKTPHPIDISVGERVRMRRKFIGMTLENLALNLGITFQQVQKYERGWNRISASKLWEISRALKTPLSYFFEGCERRKDEAFEAPSSERAAQDFLATPEGIKLAHAFLLIKSVKRRRKLLDLVKALSED